MLLLWYITVTPDTLYAYVVIYVAMYVKLILECCWYNTLGWLLLVSAKFNNFGLALCLALNFDKSVAISGADPEVHLSGFCSDF